jgi:hypothetical protein
MNKIFFGATEKVVRTASCRMLTVPLPCMAYRIVARECVCLMREEFNLARALEEEHWDHPRNGQAPGRPLVQSWLPS